ncbi:hypothetical protein BYT27DRAFT_7262258 [Phlegmacium glaucopus]|nr:hypothetical protein BYT27DRAFT_7262258 [Phlegmacium glaucopus]
MYIGSEFHFLGNIIFLNQNHSLLPMSSTISDSDLLAKQNRYLPIGPFDGKVAAAIQDFVCTTPNQNQILLPPMQRRDVYLRSDFRYGPDDPTLWPQPYLLEYPHLGAIPRRPEDPNDSLSIMWWNPTREDFCPLDNGVLDGLGQLSILKYWMLEGMMKEMQERIFEYRKKCHPNPPNSLLLLLATAISSTCI